MKLKNLYFWRSYIETFALIIYIFIGFCLSASTSIELIIFLIWFLILVAWISIRRCELMELKYEKEKQKQNIL